MKVVILTQQDYFFISENIQKVLTMREVEVPLVAVVNSKGSLINRKSYLLRGYGIIQGLKMGLTLIRRKLEDFLDTLSRYRLFKIKCSVQSVCRSNNIEFKIVNDPNATDFVNLLAEITPDIILSFSSPCVFKDDLLNVPKLGCINLHCSYLPNYAGLWPSFWYLFNGEVKGGATVHFMDNRIDNGKIISQCEFKIQSNITVFELIKKSKKFGGELVLESLQKLKDGSLEMKENKAEEGSYFSWPSLQEMKSFRKSGGKFI